MAVTSTWFNRSYLAGYLMLALPVGGWAALEKRAAYSKLK
jgi:hypothetical protein